MLHMFFKLYDGFQSFSYYSQPCRVFESIWLGGVNVRAVSEETYRFSEEEKVLVEVYKKNFVIKG